MSVAGANLKSDVNPDVYPGDILLPDPLNPV